MTADELREKVAQTIADTFFAMEAGETPAEGGYPTPTPNAGDYALAEDLMPLFGDVWAEGKTAQGWRNPYRKADPS